MKRTQSLSEPLGASIFLASYVTFTDAWIWSFKTLEESKNNIVVAGSNNTLSLTIFIVLILACFLLCSSDTTKTKKEKKAEKDLQLLTDLEELIHLDPDAEKLFNDPRAQKILAMLWSKQPGVNSGVVAGTIGVPEATVKRFKEIMDKHSST